MDTDGTLSEAISMRNFIVHQYDDVDFDVVWQTATENIPSLRLLVAQWTESIPQESTE